MILDIVGGKSVYNATKHGDLSKGYSKANPICMQEYAEIRNRKGTGYLSGGTYDGLKTEIPIM